MKLCELMRDTGVLPGPFPEREELKGLSCDSRRVEPGFAFVCIRGTAVDGHEYVRQAVENGAAVIVAEHPVELGVADGVPQVLVASGRRAWARMCANWFGNPAERLRMIGVTGTNGKTTTTSLVGEILSAYYKEVFVVGNIGTPYTSTALRTTDQSYTVAEISSFQLETITDFRPDVSAILNITPDHLNRHKTMDCYINVKERIAENQTKEDACILNYDDPVLRRFGETIAPRVIYFSSRELLPEGICLDGDMIIRNHDGVRMEIINIHDMNLLGRHNHENVMAAAAIAMELGVPLETIQSVIRDFKAVEHRIEFVAEKAGVKYYNDSKGTNPDAAIQAVNAMPGPTILIAGGYDKNSEYDEWIRSFGKKVRYMVLLGQTREKIAECAARHGFTNVMYAEDMQEAVRVCASYANAGEYVLLSPACASWGMFKDYEERGMLFKKYVHALNDESR